MESSFIPYAATTILPTGHVLVLAPHPDDEVFGCAGTILQHLSQGNRVSVIIVTDGQAAATHDGNDSVSDYIKTRRQESQQAARILGYGSPEFWGITDRTLRYSEELVQRVVDYIGEKEITQVYSPSVMEIHPDHHELANIAVEAVRRCGKEVTLAMYEIGVPLYPNLLLDITDLVERKQQAMVCFASQQRIQDYRRHIDGLNNFRTYTLPPDIKAAEAYYVLDGATLQNQPWRKFGPSQQTNVLEEVYRKISQLESTVTRQAEELATVYKSRSWRLTAPLRWLNRRR